MNPIQVFGYVGIIATLLAAFVCCFIVVINMFRTVIHRKPGVPLFPNWWESPFNILFRPGQLTDRGLTARRWCFYGVAGFVACCVLFAVIGVITGVTNS